MKFSRIVQKIRMQSGLTQAEFANNLKVCPPLISHYETGFRKGPSVPVAKKLIKLARKINYELTLDDIFPG